jgi:hypothetical protein
MTDAILGFSSLGVIVLSAGFWIRSLRRVEIPKNRGFYVATWLIAGALGVTAVLGTPGWLGGIPAASGIFASLFFLGAFAIGGQKVGEEAIRVGAPIPDFTATDEHGSTFDSKSLAGHPVLIKFFRGHW